MILRWIGGRSAGGPASLAPVDVATMTDAYNEDDEVSVADVVEDAIVAHAEAITVVVTYELSHLCVRPAWIVPERGQGAQNGEGGGRRDVP